MVKVIVSNSTTTPLTVFTRIDIPVGPEFDLTAAAVEALVRDGVVKALMDAGLVSIEERPEPAPPAAEEVITSEPPKIPETVENSPGSTEEVTAPITDQSGVSSESVTAEAPSEVTALADLPQPAAFPPEAAIPAADGEPTPPAAEPKAEKRSSAKKPAADA